MHCSVLAEEAIKLAIDDYKKKKRDERIEKARGMRQPVKRKVKVIIFQLHSNEKVVPHSNMT